MHRTTLSKSLGWTSVFQDEDVATLKVVNRVRYSMCWDIVSDEMGEGCKGQTKTLRKGLESWWHDGYIYRAKRAFKDENATGWSVMFSAPL